MDSFSSSSLLPHVGGNAAGAAAHHNNTINDTSSSSVAAAAPPPSALPPRVTSAHNSSSVANNNNKTNTGNTNTNRPSSRPLTASDFTQRHATGRVGSASHHHHQGGGAVAPQLPTSSTTATINDRSSSLVRPTTPLRTTAAADAPTTSTFTGRIGSSDSNLEAPNNIEEEAETQMTRRNNNKNTINAKSDNNNTILHDNTNTNTNANTTTMSHNKNSAPNHNDDNDGLARDSDDFPLPHITVDAVLDLEHGLDALLSVYAALGCPNNTAIDNACVEEDIFDGGADGRAFVEVQLPTDGTAIVARRRVTEMRQQQQQGTSAASASALSMNNNSSGVGRTSPSTATPAKGSPPPPSRGGRGGQVAPRTSSSSSSTPARRRFSSSSSNNNALSHRNNNNNNNSPSASTSISAAAAANSKATPHHQHPNASSSSSSPSLRLFPPPGGEKRAALQKKKGVAGAGNNNGVADDATTSGANDNGSGNTNTNSNNNDAVSSSDALLLVAMQQQRAFVSPFRLILEVALQETLDRQNSCWHMLAGGGGGDDGDYSDGVGASSQHRSVSRHSNANRSVGNRSPSSHRSDGGGGGAADNNNANADSGGGGGGVHLGSAVRNALHVADDAQQWVTIHHGGSRGTSPNGTAAAGDASASSSPAGGATRARLRQQQHDAQLQRHDDTSGDAYGLPAGGDEDSAAKKRRAAAAAKKGRRGGAPPPTPHEAAASIVNWYRGLRYKQSLRERRAVAAARGAMVSRTNAAATIQRAWARYLQVKAFRDHQQRFIDQYLSTTLLREESAMTVQQWYRERRRCLAFRDACRLSRRKQLQLSALPTGAELAQERAYGGEHIAAVLKGIVTFKKALTALREEREATGDGANVNINDNGASPFHGGDGSRDALIERTYATLRLQQWYRALVASRLVRARRAARAAEELRTRQHDAARVIGRFAKYVCAQVRRREHAEMLAQQRIIRHQHEQATVIQSIVRMSQQRSIFEARRKLRDASARKVQSAVRIFNAKQIRAMLLEDKLTADAYEQLMELIIGVQCQTRGFLVRARLRREKAQRYLCGFTQRMGRGYAVREAIRRDAAARVIQRLFQMVVERQRYRRYLAHQEAEEANARLHFAARTIQNSWRKKMFRNEIADRIWERGVRHKAARKIQHAAKPLIAMGQLRTLKQKQSAILFQRQCSQAATLIAATFRGYAQFRRYSRIRAIILKCADLIARVASGFLCRKYQVCADHKAAKANKAALLIQRGFKASKDRAERKQRLAAKRAMAIETRARSEGAVIIQRNFRMMRQYRAFNRLMRARRSAALVIQTFTRAKSSCDEYHRLAVKQQRSRAAFAIQRVWIRNKRRLFQLREIREMEQNLASLVFIKFIQHEFNERNAIEDAAALEHRAAMGGFAMIQKEIIRRRAFREALWLSKAPIEVQEDAILDVQRVVRGFIGRRRALKMKMMGGSSSNGEEVDGPSYSTVSSPPSHAMAAAVADSDLPPPSSSSAGIPSSTQQQQQQHSLLTAPQMKAMAMEMRRTTAMVKELRAAAAAAERSNGNGGDGSTSGRGGLVSKKRSAVMMGATTEGPSPPPSSSATVAGSLLLHPIANANTAAVAVGPTIPIYDDLPLPSNLPSSFLPRTFEMWLQWLRCHPSIASSRLVERLLQREVAARRRMVTGAETSFFQLFGEFNLLLEAEGLQPHRNGVVTVGLDDVYTCPAEEEGAIADGGRRSVSDATTSVRRGDNHDGVSDSRMAFALVPHHPNHSTTHADDSVSNKQQFASSMVVVSSSAAANIAAARRVESATGARHAATVPIRGNNNNTSNSGSGGSGGGGALVAVSPASLDARSTNAVGRDNDDASTVATTTTMPMMLPPVVQRLAPTLANGRVEAVPRDVADATTHVPTPAVVASASHFTKTSRTAKEQLQHVVDRLSENYIRAVCDGGDDDDGDEGVIDLENLNLSEEEVRTVLERLRGTRSVTRIYLGGNALRDGICTEIAAVLESNGELLARTDANTSSSTSSSAATAIPTRPTIVHLSLANTLITDVGASHLAYGIAKCSSLQTVDVSGTAVSNQYRSHIRQMLAHRAQLAAGSRLKLIAAEEAALKLKNTPPELRETESCLPSRRRRTAADEGAGEARHRLAQLKAEAARRRAAKEEAMLLRRGGGGNGDGDAVDVLGSTNINANTANASATRANSSTANPTPAPMTTDSDSNATAAALLLGIGDSHLESLEEVATFPITNPSDVLIAEELLRTKHAASVAVAAAAATRRHDSAARRGVGGMFPTERIERYYAPEPEADHDTRYLH